MNRRPARGGAIGFRVLTIALILSAGLVAAGPRAVFAQDDESGLDDNTFTGPNFGWSVEWDDDVWAFDSEDNSGGADYVSLTTADEDEPFALAQFFGANEFDGDPADCVTGWEGFIADRDTVSDVKVDDTVNLPETPDDGANASYTYVSETDDGTEFDLIEYVACQTLVEDEAVLIHTLITTPNVYEDFIPLIEDLAAEITLPDGRDSRDDDRRDQDDDVTPDADDEDVTPETDEEDGDITPEADDGDEETPEADDESGIDGSEYVGPNFGWALTWDEDVWTVDAEDNSGGTDFISLASEDPSAFVLIQGIEAFDGDPDACAEDWGDLIEDRDGTARVREGRNLEIPDEPRGATGALYTYRLELDDGETIDLVEYVQCYELVEDEAVLEVILQAPADTYEDVIPLFEDLVAELDID